jgi:serine/threonine protein kinase
MNLNPDQARRLAKALLDDSESEADQTGTELRGRLTPGPFGHYTVRRLVGLGGMGEVYEAQQENPDRRVAIKVVRPDLISPEALRRFEHETRILARLQHPGISPIYEAGRIESRSGSTPFFAMEFVEGKPLTAHAAELKLSIRQRLELFLLACDAVEHAHRKGVIHRDLKPANILVDSTGRPRVMDFGVARATDSDIRATTVHTEIGKLVGTLPYMSPEQVGGHPDDLDTRSDVYSLGVVLYELLGGKLPYDIRGDGRGRIPEAVRAIQESEPAPLSSIDRVFRGDLDTILAKALAKEKERRYQSVGELAADIRRHLNDEPIEARRASTWYQLRKLARRSPAATILAVLLVGTLGLSTVASMYLAANERAARTASGVAEQAAQRATNLAQQREREARKQQATSDAVTKFIIRTLYAASPNRLGRDVKLVDALDAASTSVGELVAEEPEAAAMLRHALGQVFHELDDLPRAQKELSAALDIINARELRNTPLGLDVRLRFGETLLTAGKLEEAEALGRELGDDAERAFGFTHRMAIGARHLVAQSYNRRQDWGRGLPILREVYNTTATEYGKDDPVGIGILTGLCEALVNVRLFGEAEPLLARLLEQIHGIEGPGSHAYLRASVVKIDLLLETGRAPEALSLSENVLAKRTESMGAEHRTTAAVRDRRISALLLLKKYDEALLALRDHDRRTRASLGEDHPESVLVSGNLGAWLARTGNLDEGIPILQRVFELNCKQYGEASAPAVATLNNMVFTLVQHRRFEQAEPLAHKLLDLARQVFEPDDWRLDLTEGTVGRCLRGLRKFDEAEPHLLAAWQRLRDRYGAKHAQSVEKLKDVIDLYEAWERPDKVAEYRALLPISEAESKP